MRHTHEDVENLHVKHKIGFTKSSLSYSFPNQYEAAVSLVQGLFSPITTDYCVTNVIGFLTAGLVRKRSCLVVVFKQNWLQRV